MSSLGVGEVFREQHDRSVSVITEAIGESAFDDFSAEGRAMTIGEGVAFAAENQRPRRRPAPAVKTEPRTVLTRRDWKSPSSSPTTSATGRSQPGCSLVLDERTVETPATNIFNKLGLNSRTQINRWLAGPSEPTLTAAEEGP
jgi:hypothetical protein